MLHKKHHLSGWNRPIRETAALQYVTSLLFLWDSPHNMQFKDITLGSILMDISYYIWHNWYTEIKDWCKWK